MPNETISEFITALKKIAEKCEFPDLEDRLRDALVCGILNGEIQSMLLMNSMLTFKVAQDMALAHEAAVKNVAEIKDGKPQEEMNVMGRAVKVRRRNEKIFKCFRCGYTNHREEQCFFKDKRCFKCQKLGHISRVCKNGNWRSDRNNCSIDEEAEATNGLFNINQVKDTSNMRNYMVKVRTSGRDMNMLIDSGTRKNIISEKTYIETWVKSERPRIEKDSTKLVQWNRQRLSILGKIKADVKVNKRSITMELLVIEGPGPNLIGREAFDQIGIGLKWISRRLTTRMNRLHPKESEDNENGKEHFQNRFKSQENVYARKYNGKGKWEPGKIKTVLRPRNYEVIMENGVTAKRHQDQLMRRVKEEVAEDVEKKEECNTERRREQMNDPNESQERLEETPGPSRPIRNRRLPEYLKDCATNWGKYTVILLEKSSTKDRKYILPPVDFTGIGPQISVWISSKVRFDLILPRLRVELKQEIEVITSKFEIDLEFTKQHLKINWKLSGRRQFIISPDDPHSSHLVCFKMKMLLPTLGLVFFVSSTFATNQSISKKNTFEIDYENNVFLKDGQPFQYISGAIHYFRVPEDLWEDRLLKMRAAGLNTIETYIEWSSHEPEPGVYDFNGMLDFEKFIKKAQDLGLLVILRPSPYINSERDMGGLPYWLLRIKKDIRLRRSDPTYLEYVGRWYNVLLPKVKPLMYHNGGPIIKIQVENEYGSYACDTPYMDKLVEMLLSHLGNDTLLYSTDGPFDYNLACGKATNVFQTIDFGPGPNLDLYFKTLRKYQPNGPLVNSEFYSGWFDAWGEPHQILKVDIFIKSLEYLLSHNVSINMYMFHGGTSFGYTSGILMSAYYRAMTTSYDYAAPLSEAGDTTEAYHRIRDVLAQYSQVHAVPPNSPKMSIAPQKLQPYLSLLHSTQNLNLKIYERPLTFEEVFQAGGLVLYTTEINHQPEGPAPLRISSLKDRGYVYVNKSIVGLMDRNHTQLTINVKQNYLLDILVESEGRVTAGIGLDDFKGISDSVFLGDQVLTNWTSYKVDIKLPGSNETPSIIEEEAPVPGAYWANITVPESTPKDTFLKLDGWGKGFAWLNGHPLGRYWPTKGPQQTLYVPAPFWQKDGNVLVLLEMEKAPCGGSSSCTVEFINHHILDVLPK
ncbi:GLB1L [Cordylochernes scorpioides]|uniref:Beta-galactosidase n=1 Tax=Cordylochernes scorpioides TaxID=51811 RepID=A0ABY6KTW3_9ARAC|nr:GLB1L [Cordylochernes scorpioides]